MDMTLQRSRTGPQGCFSYLKDEIGAQIAVTVEHAYEDPPGVWSPKIPPGRYLCVRGIHRLNLSDGSLGLPFETFEITGVPNHSGILFHPGNDEYDSHGCVCPGEQFGTLKIGGMLLEAVLESKVAFAYIMAMQAGLGSFELTVVASNGAA